MRTVCFSNVYLPRLVGTTCGYDAKKQLNKLCTPQVSSGWRDVNTETTVCLYLEQPLTVWVCYGFLKVTWTEFLKVKRLRVENTIAIN
jgi:hypothetical protein